jgi:hypothetical protein
MKKFDWRCWLFIGYLLVYFLTQAFIGSRPPFPFFPFGLGLLIVLAIGIGAAILAQRANNMRGALLTVFSVCCLLFAGYTLAQAFMHMYQGGNIYWIRSLAGLPLLFFAWRFGTDPNKIFLIFGAKGRDV